MRIRKVQKSKDIVHAQINWVLAMRILVVIESCPRTSHLALAKELGVSVITLRRQLDKLCQHVGVVVINYGNNAKPQWEIEDYGDLNFEKVRQKFKGNFK